MRSLLSLTTPQELLQLLNQPVSSLLLCFPDSVLLVRVPVTISIWEHCSDGGKLAILIWLRDSLIGVAISAALSQGASHVDRLFNLSTTIPVTILHPVFFATVWRDSPLTKPFWGVSTLDFTHFNLQMTNCTEVYSTDSGTAPIS